MTCDWCEAGITSTPVRDGAGAYCDEDCDDAASERYWLRVWAS